MAATPSGKDKLLRWARIYCDEFNLSGDARTFSELMCAFGEVEMTGWNESVRNYIPDDWLEAGIRGFQAIMNDAAGRGYTVLKARDTAHVSLQMGGGGEPAIGDPAYLLRTVQVSDPASFDASKGVMTADFLPSASLYDENAWFPLGVVLHPATSLSSTISGTSIDMGAGVTIGIHALLHITASDGGTWAFKTQDSANDSAWSDVVGGGFTLDGSAVGSEAIEVAGSAVRATGPVETVAATAAQTAVAGVTEFAETANNVASGAPATVTAGVKSSPRTPGLAVALTA